MATGSQYYYCPAMFDQWKNQCMHKYNDRRNLDKSKRFSEKKPCELIVKILTTWVLLLHITSEGIAQWHLKLVNCQHTGVKKNRKETFILPVNPLS